MNPRWNRGLMGHSLVGHSLIGHSLIGCWLLLIGFVLAGCGGGQKAISSRQNGQGQTLIVIHWPARIRGTKVIPVDANLIRVQITSAANGAGTLIATQDATRNGNLTAPTTTLAFNNLPPGQFWVTMVAYNGYASGNTPQTPAQATASAPLTIAAGQTTTTNLTMASTITQLVLTETASGSGVANNDTRECYFQRKFTFNVVAKDASGNIVLTNALTATVPSSQADIVTTTNNKGGTFSVNPLGPLQMVTVTVTATEANVAQSFNLLVRDQAIYVADSHNNRIVRMDDMYGTNWKTYSYASDPFNNVQAIYVASDNTIFIGDTNNKRVVKINDMDGNGRTVYYGTEVGGFAFVTGLVLDSKNNLYIADGTNSRIVRTNSTFSANGISLYNHGSDHFNTTRHIAIDSSDRIYITDSYNNRIVVVDDIQGNGWSTYAASFTLPVGVAVDKNFNIYVSSWDTRDLVSFNLIPSVSTHYSLGFSPAQNAVDNLGRIYVTGIDNSNNFNVYVIRMNDANGNGRIAYGSYGTGVGNWDSPAGIFVR